MKEFSSKHIALKADVTGVENVLFAGIILPGHFTGWGSAGVNSTESLKERLPGQFESSEDTEHIQSMDEAISAPYNCLGQAVLIVAVKLRYPN